MIEFIDLFARLAELKVQKYLLNFPYWLAHSYCIVCTHCTVDVKI